MAELDAGETPSADADEWLTSARSVADGALLHFGSNLVTKSAKFLLNFLLTNALGAAGYGVYAFGQRIAKASLRFTDLGTGVALTKYLSANLDDAEFQDGVLLVASLTTAVVSVLAGALLFVTAARVNALTLDAPAFTTVLRLFAVAIPFLSMTRLASTTFRGLEMPLQKNVVRTLIPVVRLVVVGTAVLAGFGLVGASVGFGLASALTFLLAAYVVLSRTGVRPAAALALAEVKAFYNYAIPLSASKTGRLLYNQVDVLMVGLFLTASDVGIYNVALLLAGTITIPLAGFNQLFSPVASRLYSDDDVPTLEAIYAAVTRWTITVTLFGASALLVYRREVLALFGDAFTEGAVVLTLLVGGHLVNASVGPSNDVLTMTNHQYVVMVNHWGFGALNAVLNYAFILEFGLVGAALATASVLGALNVVRLLEVWYLEGLFAYTRRLWKPVVAAACATSVMLVGGTLLSGPVVLVGGGGLGGLTYAALIYGLGIEQQDRRLARNYLAQFR